MVRRAAPRLEEGGLREIVSDEDVAVACCVKSSSDASKNANANAASAPGGPSDAQDLTVFVREQEETVELPFEVTIAV
ncbi:unnamed protein product [Phytophthora lilii]|uniref:Unnamed protein product n=1 Tax=Phytophthora lilii TaxID=2077276 RepID=A0A9W6TST2_9STRA|nr:unnamed protein product [Phytophthora lilii]